MGQRGPVPKLQSSPVDSAVPKKPPYLDGEAAKEWKRVCGELLKCGNPAPSDRSILEGYCIAYAEVRNANRILEEEGRMLTVPIQNAKGEVLGETQKPHPMVGIQQKMLVIMKSYLDSLGLNPIARRRLNAEAPLEDDPYAELMRNP